MKLVKAASGKQTIKMSKSEWESIGKKSGWMKKAQVNGAPAQGQPAPAQGQPAGAPTTLNGILQAYPEIAKSYETLRTTIPWLKKVLDSKGVNWQTIPEFLDLLG